MRRTLALVLSGLLAASSIGCGLREIRNKTKFGPEFRHRGSDRTNGVRWTVQQGFDFKWDKGITTGIAYRRRDMDNGNGDNDNGVWFDVSFPVWKAKKKPDPLKRRIEDLEKRLAELEAQSGASGGK